MPKVGGAARRPLTSFMVLPRTLAPLLLLVLNMGGRSRRRESWSEETVAFFLIRSDVKKSSVELANAIARIPEMEEVCFTEGKYSFLARLSAAPEKFEKLQARLARCAGILEIERLNAPVVVRR